MGASDEEGRPVLSLPRRTNSVNAPIHIHKPCMGDRQVRRAMIPPSMSMHKLSDKTLAVDGVSVYNGGIKGGIIV